ncbi:hypothetical protein [Klebsiella michiganensis]|uniref:hypothetical protein n=1 Tax=Klebsiella michiganensis TaxID=1134687 RepID=UPI0015EB071A|nr:hypothetical protein [Klebsiella michiganensis]QLS23643.1 hypothetical protein HV324_31700 [Klebsiella michiganensis]
MPPARAIEGLNTFKDLGLPDIRNLESAQRRDSLDEIAAGATAEEALGLLEFHMGFAVADMVEIEKQTHIVDWPLYFHTLFIT